jgi:hypothetical protein
LLGCGACTAADVWLTHVPGEAEHHGCPTQASPMHRKRASPQPMHLISHAKHSHGGQSSCSVVCTQCGQPAHGAAVAPALATALPAGPPLHHAVPPPARGGPMAPSNVYARPAQFATPQCPPVYEDASLPEPAIQPDGTEVVCDCDDGLLGQVCVACPHGTLGDYLREQLEDATEGSGDVKSCSGNVSVRVVTFPSRMP